MNYEQHTFYIDGQWVEPARPTKFVAINPATEEPVGSIALGDETDVDRAVAAARKALPAYSATTPKQRLDLLQSILAEYQARFEQFATAISTEMGAPMRLAREQQAAIGVGHLKAMIELLPKFEFEQRTASGTLVREPVGVCALITPWNWPINQVAAKVVPALAAGCTMVLKPSEYAPFSAALWAEALHAAGVPRGVFNMIYGDGPVVGSALARHPDVDMVSFTGSTRAGVEVARNAAPTVKRVHQELGGKSPNVLLDDVDLDKAVESSVTRCMNNSGQSCNAPTRLLVPAARLEEAEAIARRTAESLVVGDPTAPATTLGPVVSQRQFDRVQQYIDKGVSEGARVVAGGPGRPDGLAKGFYVRPTIFSRVRNDMTIAREEIFGPVLCLLPYETDTDAVAIANDTPYGLAAYVWGKDPARTRSIASKLRAGQVIVNGARADMNTPFGGFKQSGNGREWGEHGLLDFLEVKAIIGA
jgi:aldehyde dehydrogenase (NAD+)